MHGEMATAAYVKYIYFPCNSAWDFLRAYFAYHPNCVCVASISNAGTDADRTSPPATLSSSSVSSPSTSKLLAASAATSVTTGLPITTGISNLTLESQPPYRTAAATLAAGSSQGTKPTTKAGNQNIQRSTSYPNIVGSTKASLPTESSSRPSSTSSPRSSLSILLSAAAAAAAAAASSSSPLSPSLPTLNTNHRFDSVTIPASASQSTPTTNQSSDTTTSKPTTTTSAPPSGQCHVCVGSSCNSTLSMKCPDVRPYCHTHVTVTRSGETHVTRGCEFQRRCYNEWAQQTIRNDICLNISRQNNRQQVTLRTLTSALECHFCCVTANCNAGPGLVPDSVTWYKPGANHVGDARDFVYF
ncbi:hypothetical protein PoB_006507100 [Plakobranchus ocellatus]|uniref:Uncharacterized protein n=1 Tax=Plakobranchus ocellatus TaxID=259542 RepID=A0AAV4D3J0_9GAST|nr:hypothetical protein PoB_006507100 [Plakobranchus ocellatus]